MWAEDNCESNRTRLQALVLRHPHEVTWGDCQTVLSAYITCAPLSQPLIPLVHQRLSMTRPSYRSCTEGERGVEGGGRGVRGSEKELGKWGRLEEDQVLWWTQRAIHVFHSVGWVILLGTALWMKQNGEGHLRGEAVECVREGQKHYTLTEGTKKDKKQAHDVYLRFCQWKWDKGRLPATDWVGTGCMIRKCMELLEWLHVTTQSCSGDTDVRLIYY